MIAISPSGKSYRECSVGSGGSGIRCPVRISTFTSAFFTFSDGFLVFHHVRLAFVGCVAIVGEWIWEWICVFVVAQAEAYIEHLTFCEYLDNRRQYYRHKHPTTYPTALPSGVGEACCRRCPLQGRHGGFVLGHRCYVGSLDSREW